MNIAVGDIVTVDIKDNKASNTYIVKYLIGDIALLTHPLMPQIMVEKQLRELNIVSSNIKDSTERGLDFCNENRNYLDYNSMSDLDGLCMFFVVQRRLTPKQKNILSNLSGKIAKAKMGEDVSPVIEFIKKNKGFLDEFNLMWFRNFSELFSGEKPIRSKKQINSIYNMAGFIMAQMINPNTEKKVK